MTTLGTLRRWRQQAIAIRRSGAHIETIDQIIKKAEEDIEEAGRTIPTCEVDLRAYRVLLRDQKIYDDLAHRLIEEYQQRNSATDDNFLSGLFKPKNDNNGNDAT